MPRINLHNSLLNMVVVSVSPGIGRVDTVPGHGIMQVEQTVSKKEKLVSLCFLFSISCEKQSLTCFLIDIYILIDIS